MGFSIFFSPVPIHRTKESFFSAALLRRQAARLHAAALLCWLAMVEAGTRGKMCGVLLIAWKGEKLRLHGLLMLGGLLDMFDRDKLI